MIKKIIPAVIAGLLGGICHAAEKYGWELVTQPQGGPETSAATFDHLAECSSARLVAIGEVVNERDAVHPMTDAERESFRRTVSFRTRCKPESREHAVARLRDMLDALGKEIGTPQPTPPPSDPSPPLSARFPGPGDGFPLAADYYPSTSRRLFEAGAVLVRVCTDTTGRLTDTPTIGKSSGSSRLDEAALQLAKAGDGKYKLVAGCAEFKVTFELP